MSHCYLLEDSGLALAEDFILELGHFFWDLSMTQLQLLSFFERQALRGGEASCALEERSLSLYTRIASKLMKAAKVAPSWLQEKQNGKRVVQCNHNP